VLLELEIKPAAKIGGEALRFFYGRSKAGPRERALDATVKTAGKRNGVPRCKSLKSSMRKRASPVAPSHLRCGDQPAEIRVTAFVLDEQHEMRAVFEGQLAADNRVDPACRAVRREAHRTVEAVSIGQRKWRTIQARPRARSALRDAIRLAEN